MHLLVKDVFVVDDDSEAEENPDCYIGVREKDPLDDAIAQRPTLAHCFF